MSPKRTLFLHLSALSDAEYSVYIEALRDILDDDETRALSDEQLETKTVSLPVVRAWMKGRFRDLGHADIDRALQLFASQMPQKEVSGGQLLAVLRLLMHVRLGGDINEANVFAQAEPSSPTVSRHATFSSSANLASQFEPPTIDNPTSSPKPSHSRTNPFVTESFRAANTTGLSPPENMEPDSVRRASLCSAPAVPSPASKPRVDGVGVPPGSTNPFLQRAKTHSGTYEPGGSGRTPPLPPRKPSHMASSSIPSKPPPLPAKPVHTSSLYAKPSGNSSSSSQGSVKSPPPLPPHRVTPLMQQSLLASRVGASLKKAQEEASRTRILEIIRSSSDTPAQSSSFKDRGRIQSSSRSPDKGTRRPVPQPPRPTAHLASDAKSDSGAPSIASFAEVAGARVEQPRTRARPESLDRISDDSSSSDEEEATSSRSRQFTASERFSPPPMHPARRPSAHASGRAARHLRSPSYQPYIPQTSPVAASTSVNKSISTPSISNQNDQSRSPSPSPSPSPTHVRPSRSQSLHHSSSSSLAVRLTESGSHFPPSSQRKRPESVQIIPRSSAPERDSSAAVHVDQTSPFSGPFGGRNRNGDDNSGGMVNAMAARFEQPSQRGSEREKDWDNEREKEKDRNAFASLQRTFNAFQQKAQPAITRARYKAEAGLFAPRRGFVPNGPDYHMAGEGGDRLVSQNNTGDEGGMDFTPATDTDYDETSGDETIRARGRSRSENSRYYLMDRDNLKLPEGEGWTRL